MTLLETTLASLSALSLNGRVGSNHGPSSLPLSSTAKRSHWSLKAAQRPASPIDVRSFPNHATPPLHAQTANHCHLHHEAIFSNHAIRRDPHQSAHDDARARHFDSLEQARLGAFSALLQYLQRYKIATLAVVEAWRTQCISTTASVTAAAANATTGRDYTLVLLEIDNHCQAVVTAASIDCSLAWEPETVRVLLVGCWTAHCAYMQFQHQQAARHFQSLRRQRLEQCPPIHDDDALEHAAAAAVVAPVHIPGKRRPHAVIRLRIGLASSPKDDTHSASVVVAAATVDVVEQARLCMLTCAEECCTVQRHLILAQRLRQPGR
jgi:hypothetical protein